MPSDIEFRQLLLDLEDDLSVEEHRKFVFMVGEDVPKRKREEPLVEIFAILIDRGHVSETNCTYLENIFERMKLTKVAYKIARFVAGRSPPTLIPVVSENYQPIENGHLSVTKSSENQVPTAQEFLNDVNADDAVILPDDRQNSVIDATPVIIEPEPVEICLSLENIDLKIFENDFWSDEFLEKIHVTIRPYEYQRELVQSAIQARNTLICLRTGGGKTFVVALLLKYYMIKTMSLSNGNGRKFLAFFLVPRRAILKQQVEKLKQIGNLRVAPCDENNDPKQYIDNYDVIVCTPQKLLNCLKAKTVLLSNIDLLCFDECHDTVVHHQYVGIMQYLMCKEINYIPPVDSSPIIIGLTATIGIHGSNSLPIIHSLTVLCATFNCSTITTVLKGTNEEELERYVSHISEDEIICVEKDKSFDSLTLSIEKDLQNLILQLFLNKETNLLRIFPEKDLDTNGYEQNLELLRQSAQKNQHFSSVLLINYILAIYRHSNALIHLTPELVLSDLKDYFETTYRSREHPIDIDTLIYDKCQDLFNKKLTEIEETEQILSNPKLDKVVQLLKKHAEKQNSRALILVERTFYAKKICDYLQNHSELKNIINPCWLVGQSGVDCRKSNKKEDSTINDFRTSVYNVMISTDVVQAGLDIPDCSMVLRYEFVPDSIGSVQARVRARVVDCTYYLVTAKGSHNYKKEIDNRQRERDMKETLEAWKRIPSDQFKQRVMEQQTFLINKWNESLIKATLLRGNNSKDTELIGDVLCRACGYLLGQLARVRRYDNVYFVSDHDFYNRIEEKKSSESRDYGKIAVTGKALCGNKSCRSQLGRIQVLKNHPKISTVYPLKCISIKIRQIEAESGKEKMILVNQWTKMPFNIPSLETQCENNDDDNDLFHDAVDTLSSDL